MTFDPDEESLSVYGFSKHDGFPSYEVFARYNGGPWEEIYFWDSKAQQQTPWSLFGEGEIDVGPLPPKDL